MSVSLASLQDAIDSVIPSSVERSTFMGSNGMGGCKLTFRETPAYQNFKGEQVLDIYCSVLEGGELIQLKTPGFFVAESSTQLQKIVSKLHSNKVIDRLVRFSANPDSGEVMALLEVPIEDSTVDSIILGSFISRYLIEQVEAYGMVTGSKEKALIKKDIAVELSEREKVLENVEKISIFDATKAAFNRFMKQTTNA